MCVKEITFHVLSVFIEKGCRNNNFIRRVIGNETESFVRRIKGKEDSGNEFLYYQESEEARRNLILEMSMRGYRDGPRGFSIARFSPAFILWVKSRRRFP